MPPVQEKGCSAKIRMWSKPGRSHGRTTSARCKKKLPLREYPCFSQEECCYILPVPFLLRKTKKWYHIFWKTFLKWSFSGSQDMKVFPKAAPSGATEIPV